uniref:Uncharacterized protein n=1 Tax=Ciona savignyi TaxID=51511 RepID=H2ZJR8_CIOSA
MAASQAQQAMSSDEKEARSVWRNLASEYTTMYAPWPRQEKYEIRPPSNGEFIYDSTAKHDMKTMYDANFVEHEATVRTKCLPPKSAHQKLDEQKMNCLSTYDESYKYKKGDRRPPFRPNPADHQTIEGHSHAATMSVNQETYRAYTQREFTGAKRDKIVIEQEQGVFPTDDNALLTTTVQETFRSPSSQSKRQPIIPVTCTIPNQSKMALQTTHMADYTRKEQSRPASAVPALKKDRRTFQWKVPGSKLNFTSTVQNDYINHMNVRRPKSFKPLHQYVASDTPFANQTHYNHDFREKPIQGSRPDPWRPEGNLRILDKGLFQDATQYKEAHCQTREPHKRATIIKPKTTHQQRTMKFYDDTSYNVNYRSFETTAGRRDNFKPVRNYTPPDIAFNVSSTAHAHYKGDPAPPSKICKPVTNKRIGEIIIT